MCESRQKEREFFSPTDSIYVVTVATFMYQSAWVEEVFQCPSHQWMFTFSCTDEMADRYEFIDLY